MNKKGSHFRLYLKAPGDRQFRAVDWASGSQVFNLIHASIFTQEEVEILKARDLAHPDNSHLSFEFRPVRW